MKRVKWHFEDNLDFYKYVKSNDICLDHKFFVRGKFNIKQCINSYHFSSDLLFNTSHDTKKATIISNDLIRIYLEYSLSLIKKKNCEHSSIVKSEISSKGILIWTGKKASLIELIYAIYADGAFNNGNASIKEIVEICQKAFNIDLGNFSRSFSELKTRKKEKIKYLYILIEKLLAKMEEDED